MLAFHTSGCGNWWMVGDPFTQSRATSSTVAPVPLSALCLHPSTSCTCFTSKIWSAFYIQPHGSRDCSTAVAATPISFSSFTWTTQVEELTKLANYQPSAAELRSASGESQQIDDWRVVTVLGFHGDVSSSTTGAFRLDVITWRWCDAAVFCCIDRRTCEIASNRCWTRRSDHRLYTHV